jgi:hypothetical protein
VGADALELPEGLDEALLGLSYGLRSPSVQSWCLFLPRGTDPNNSPAAWSANLLPRVSFMTCKNHSILSFCCFPLAFQHLGISQDASGQPVCSQSGEALAGREPGSSICQAKVLHWGTPPAPSTHLWCSAPHLLGYALPSSDRCTLSPALKLTQVNTSRMVPSSWSFWDLTCQQEFWSMETGS